MDARELNKVAQEMSANQKLENVECGLQKPDIKSRLKRFFTKYLLQGQKLEKDQAEALQHFDPNASLYERLMIKHRRALGFFIPIIFWQTIWWILAIRHNYFANFPTHYPMTITMILGSFIGGATAEGGGAVAFPVMTLILHLSPAIARDFSFMIQCCGTASGGFCIMFMKVKVEWHSIVFVNMGSLCGLVFGLEVVDHLLAPPTKKLIFVSVWWSFCVALFLLNRQYKRRTFDSIQDFKFWKAAVLVCSGFLGGIFTAMTGSGTCICSFSVLCLLFRVTEKIATPTSVVLMSINTVAGLFWRQFVQGGAEPEAWKYLSVALPTACIAGALGALLVSHCHRLVHATTCYTLDTLALVTALCVIPMTWQYWVMVVSLIVICGSIFNLLSFFGQRMLAQFEKEEKQLLALETLQGCDNSLNVAE